MRIGIECMLIGYTKFGTCGSRSMIKINERTILILTHPSKVNNKIYFQIVSDFKKNIISYHKKNFLYPGSRSTSLCIYMYIYKYLSLFPLGLKQKFAILDQRIPLCFLEESSVPNVSKYTIIAATTCSLYNVEHPGRIVQMCLSPNMMRNLMSWIFHVMK